MLMWIIITQYLISIHQCHEALLTVCFLSGSSRLETKCQWSIDRKTLESSSSRDVISNLTDYFKCRNYKYDVVYNTWWFNDTIDKNKKAKLSWQLIISSYKSRLHCKKGIGNMILYLYYLMQNISSVVLLISDYHAFQVFSW